MWPNPYLSRLKQRLLHRFLPSVVDWLTWLATFEARRRLKKMPRIRLLVDNSVLAHAVTHETATISTGVELWGGVVPFDTGYSARIPVHLVDDATETYKNICFIPGIAYLARKGLIDLCQSAELRAETYYQPVGRFKGYGYLDYSLLSGVHMDSVDGTVFPTLGPRWMGLPSAKEQQGRRISGYGDPLHVSLVAELGSKHSQDAWHLCTAENKNLYAFLTTDFKFRRQVRARSRREPLISMNARVLTPKEFGEELSIAPLPPIFFSYHNASFFVRTDVTMPNGRRRPVTAYRSRE